MVSLTSLKRSAFAMCLLAGLVAGADRPVASEDVVEETAPLTVTIDGRAERLEALVVHRVGEGRLPVALIVNGHIPDPATSHPAGIAHLAHDFAHRGWLAAVVGWRGYGASTGAVQDDGGTCTAPTTRRYLDEHAADLAAALAALRTRPDADPKIAVGLGISIGGASMLDLAAAADRPLTAVISISGGLVHDSKPFMPDPACAPFEADLVRTIGTFGAARVPTLWIYASNDSLFRPAFVRRMADAYRQGGGRVDLDMVPPFGLDGHTLFRWEASPRTQPLIDQFLHRNGLPAMAEDGNFAALAEKRSIDDRETLAYYLRMPTEKALALPSEGDGLFISFAKRSIGEARREALLRCEAASRVACRIAAENQGVVAGVRPPIADDR